MISTSQPSEADETESPSSLVAEPPTSDSQEKLITNENLSTDNKSETEAEERKRRRLERRKALALERSPLPPKLGGALKSANNTIDLTNEDDDPSNKWFKDRFNTESIKKKVKSPEDAKLFAVPRHIPKNAPKSLITKQALHKSLQASLALKRRKAQEERRRMYEEDNEHLRAGSEEEEEEEEEVVFRKKRAKKEEEDSDDDDEDYNPADDEKAEDNDDEMSVNLLNDSFTYDVFNNAKKSGPGSIVSNFDSRSQEDPTEKLPTMSQIMGRTHEDPLSNHSATDEILQFCSGKFEDFPDTLQMLLGDEKEEDRKLFGGGSESSGKLPSVDNEEQDEEDDDAPVRRKTKHLILDSDEEEEVDDKVEETPLTSQDVFEASGEATTASESTSEEVQAAVQLRRIVVSGDEESEEEDEEDEGEEDGDDEEESEGEEEAEEEETEEEPVTIPEPNFDDEDDELAVLKRIEHQEYKKKVNKKTLFDDEASLSGDDVGSDLEDEEGVENAYEAEEGDADDVPDDGTIRRQNFKMLLKQENDAETRALAKLQDRLLADGDLGGVETNRQFRFKIREELDMQIGLNDIGNGDQQDEADDEPEEDEKKKKERAEMIKFRIEHAEELELLSQSKDDEDDPMFARAGRIIKKVERTVVEVSTEVHTKSSLSLKPSLLSKTTLASSFQEVLAGGAGAAPKQMYVQNFNSEATSSSSGASDSKRMSGNKRGPTSAISPKAKRDKSSKLSLLE